MLRGYTTRLTLVSSHRNLGSASSTVDRLVAEARKKGFTVQEAQIRGDDPGEKREAAA